MSDQVAPGIVFRRIHRELNAIHFCIEGLERLPRQLKAQQNRVVTAEKTRTDTADFLKKTKVDQHQTEVSLRQLIALMEKYLRQLDESSDPKVFTALTHELATTKKKIGETEDKVLELMTIIDETAPKVPELEKGIQKAKTDLGDFEKEAGTKKSDLESLLVDHKNRLAELEPLIPSEFAQGYFRTKKATFQDCLSSVADKTCNACQVTITSQMQNEIDDNRYVTCKSCGRILYQPGTD